MNNYNNNFNVPTLTLSTSRAKKMYAPVIPTRDYAYGLPSNPPSNQNDPILDNKTHPTISNNPYTQPEKYRRPPIFPPRTPTNPHSHLPVQNAPDHSTRDLNKKVYLETRDEYNVVQHEGNPLPRAEEANRGELRQSGSRGGLLSNPTSSRVVEQEMQERSLSRKADISKVLFDRRLSKLLEEANFYDGEMMALCKDELAPHLDQLERLREENMTTHKDILQGLTALIN